MADNVDIIVILAGYMMMIATFVSLYINMRRMGSRYTLGKQHLDRISGNSPAHLDCFLFLELIVRQPPPLLLMACFRLCLLC